MRWVMISALLASCYSPPSYGDCAITCQTGYCPSGLACVEGMCRIAGVTGACPMQDGSIVDMPMREGDAMADAIEIDAPCSHTCYAASTGTSLMGTAGCRPMSNGCNGNAVWLDHIDLCACSVGEPELYIERTSGSSANIAVVGPRLAVGHGYSMMIDNGTCYGAGQACPGNAVAGCSQLSEVDGWFQIAVGPGTHTFRFYDDDGTGCVTVQFGFMVTL